MTLWFALVLTAIALQRLAELRLAARNAARIRRLGGYEAGAATYPPIVALHLLFFGVLPMEFALRQPQPSVWTAACAAAFVLLQLGRAWCIRSLGPYWNTRVFVVPGMQPVRSGPYRWLKHPNYLVVTLEFLFLPLMFGCTAAAFLFPALNALLLRRRIRVEESALREAASRPPRPAAP